MSICVSLWPILLEREPWRVGILIEAVERFVCLLDIKNELTTPCLGPCHMAVISSWQLAIMNDNCNEDEWQTSSIRQSAPPTVISWASHFISINAQDSFVGWACKSWNRCYTVDIFWLSHEPSSCLRPHTFAFFTACVVSPAFQEPDWLRNKAPTNNLKDQHLTLPHLRPLYSIVPQFPLVCVLNSLFPRNCQLSKKQRLLIHEN